MGLFGMSGNTWKKVGGYALKAAPYVAAPFTGGLSIPIGMAIQGGIGAAQGAAGGGGLKGALLGGGIGAGLAAIPGASAASGTVTNLAKQGVGQALKTTGIQLGKNYATQMGTNLMSNLANKGVAPPPNKPNVYSNTLPQARDFSTPDAPSLNGDFSGRTPAAQASYASRAAAPGTAPKTNAPGTDGGDGADIPPDDGSPSWQEKYGPLIAQGAGIVGGIYGGKAMTKSAAQRSPEELAALKNSNASAAGMTDAGTSMLSESKPYMRDAGSYYSTLLHGNRAAMSQATAAPRAQLQEQLKGEESKLATSGIRGAARDVLGGRMQQANAAKVAGLTTGVQPWAANQLGQLGTQQAQTAGPLLQSAGNIYGNLLGRGFENRKYSRDEGQKGTEAVGKLASMAGQIPWKKKPAAAPTQYDPSDYATNGPPMPPPTWGDFGPSSGYDEGDYTKASNF